MRLGKESEQRGVALNTPEKGKRTTLAHDAAFTSCLLVIKKEMVHRVADISFDTLRAQ